MPKIGPNPLQWIQDALYLIAVDQPNQPYKNFEEILLKTFEEVKERPDAEAMNAARALFAPRMEENEEGVLVEVATEPIGEIPSLEVLFRMFRAANVDLGEEEIYAL